MEVLKCCHITVTIDISTVCIWIQCCDITLSKHVVIILNFCGIISKSITITSVQVTFIKSKINKFFNYINSCLDFLIGCLSSCLG